LRQAGVRFCISNGGGGFGASNTRNLPYQAGMAAAFGLPRDEALKSVTLYPAQILGVGDRLGSIEVGKSASLMLTDGDPLEIRTHVLRVFIDGRETDLGNKHQRLYDKYKARPMPATAR
jgi:imidazolonepropionase-like amidohydrolase